MTKLIILGTSNAIPDLYHETTHLALIGNDGVVMIDCGSAPTLRLNQAGIALDSVTDLIATHFHPDHVAGVPLLLMNMWLSGRQKPLRIFGLHHCLERLEDTMGFYNWENWPDFFPVAFHRLPEKAGVVVLEREAYRILASPVRHLVPTIGLRFEAAGGKPSVVYSCDTEPCVALTQLAAGADVLIHEASGEGDGHSSAMQAGDVARQAGVGRLLLIHYPLEDGSPSTLISQAEQTFAGPIALATDLMELPL